MGVDFETRDTGKSPEKYFFRCACLAIQTGLALARTTPKKNASNAGFITCFTSFISVNCIYLCWQHGSGAYHLAENLEIYTRKR